MSDTTVAARDHHRTRSTWLPHAIALALYTVLAALLTWPLAAHFEFAYPARPGEGAQDLWQNLWNLWWTGEAFRRGTNPFFTDALFFPLGASLLFHPLNLTSGVLALPLRALFGQVVAYNVLVLLSFVLGGYAVFLLARRHGCGAAAAWLGGVVYTASTFHFFHLELGHLEQISMQWLPLYALALDALFAPIVTKRALVLRAVAAAVALLCVVFTSLYMALYAALLTTLWLVWLVAGAFRRRVPLRFAVLAAPLLALLLTLLVALPTLLLPMARESQAANYMVRTVNDAARGSAAPLDALLPPPAHPLRAVLALPAPQSKGAFLGFLPLILAVVGVAMRARTAARWLVLSALAWLFSLGPALPFYQVLYSFPPLQVARYPDRFNILVLLGLGVLAALGANALLRSRGASRSSPWIALVLAALLVYELHPRGTPLTPPIDDPFYRQLAQAADRAAVLELPINRPNNMSVDMGAQTLHAHPILGGTLARAVPRLPFEWLPLVREWEYAGAPADIIDQTPQERAATLRYLDIGYIVYHRSNESGAVSPPSADTLSRIAGTPVTEVYSDSELVGFRVAPPDAPAAPPVTTQIGDGWYNLETGPAGAQRWMQVAGGTFDLFAPEARTATVQLTLLAFGQARTLDVLLDGQPVAQISAQSWLTDAQFTVPLGVGARTLRLVPTEPGTTPRDAGLGEDDRPLTVAVSHVSLAYEP